MTIGRKIGPQGGGGPGLLGSTRTAVGVPVHAAHQPEPQGGLDHTTGA